MIYNNDLLLTFEVCQDHRNLEPTAGGGIVLWREILALTQRHLVHGAGDSWSFTLRNLVVEVSQCFNPLSFILQCSQPTRFSAQISRCMSIESNMNYLCVNLSDSVQSWITCFDPWRCIPSNCLKWTVVNQINISNHFKKFQYFQYSGRLCRRIRNFQIWTVRPAARQRSWLCFSRFSKTTPSHLKVNQCMFSLWIFGSSSQLW